MKRTLLSLLGTLLLAPFAHGQNDPYLKLLADGFDQPLYALQIPGNDGHLLVLEKASGLVRVVDLASGTIMPEAFLEVTDISTQSERGLLGMAFHPDYLNNGEFFIHHSNAQGDTNIVRYEVSQGNPLQADAASRELLLEENQTFSNHNGGWIGFGPDGYLYIALGDGGSGNDPNDDAQDRTNLLGAMLRIDVNGDDFPLDSGSNYAIPQDNPYAGHSTLSPEIWSFGLRNPWRASFDRETGDLWIADVGQGAWEEVNLEPAGSNGGRNYGWRVLEGFEETGLGGEGPDADSPLLIPPVHVYDHGQGTSITGGYVYRGWGLPEYHGLYFFGDFTFTAIWGMDPEDFSVTRFTNTWERDEGSLANLASFGEGNAGQLYLIGYSSGTVYELTRPSLEYFGGPVSYPNLWHETEWFGLFNDDFFPFVYHWDHGWLYCSDEGVPTGSMWMWDFSLDWFWTNDQFYPYLYQASTDTWLLYEEGTSDPRRFWNLTTLEPIEVP